MKVIDAMTPDVQLERQRAVRADGSTAFSLDPT
jgi:hypothetical protein